MYKRFKWNPEIRFDLSVYNDLPKMKDGSRVFWGSTFELFGDWVSLDGMSFIMRQVKLYPKLTHIFLTKQPQNLIKWSPFPENCWVGVSTVDKIHFLAACHYLQDIQATVKFLSFEPLQESMMTAQPIEEHLQNGGVNWVIIGQQTPVKKETTPHIEWIQEIVEACGKAEIPVFLKDNLIELVNYESPETDFAFNKEGFYRQEFPRSK
jgi:protein gp37